MSETIKVSTKIKTELEDIKDKDEHMSLDSVIRDTIRENRELKAENKMLKHIVAGIKHVFRPWLKREIEYWLQEAKKADNEGDEDSSSHWLFQVHALRDALNKLNDVCPEQDGKRKEEEN